MPMSFKVILIGAAFVASSANAALSFEFDQPVNDCIVDMQPECFDPLFVEFSERVDALSDDKLRQNYAAIPAAILLKANKLKWAEEVSAKIAEPANRKEILSHIGISYAKAGQIQDAYRILEEIDAPLRRSYLIAAIAVQELLDGEVDSTLPPMIELMHPEFVDPIFSEVAGKLAEHGQLQKASKIAESIFDEPSQARVLAYISREFAKLGDVANARSSLQLIRDPGFEVQAWGEVGYTLHERDDETEASQIFTEAVAIATGRKPNDPAKDEQLESIAHYLIMTNHPDDAMSVIDLIGKPATRAWMLYKLGDLYAIRGETERALEYFDVAAFAATGGDDIYKQYGTLREVAVSIARTGHVDFALSVADRISDANIQGGTTKSIGDAAMAKGDITRAETIYASIDQLDLRAVALIAFARFLDMEGHAEKAAGVLAGLETALADAPVDATEIQDGNYLRGSSISNLANAYVARGDLSSGMRVALTLDITNQRLWTLIPIYAAATEAGDTALSETLGDMLFAELKAHPEPGDVLSVMTFLTTHSSNLENIELHKKFADLLEDDTSKSLLFSTIFENLTQQENYDLASQVYDLIPDTNLRDMAAIEFLKRKIETVTYTE